MNWIEFVEMCEREMEEKGVDPSTVKMRVEVSDSYYDKDVVGVGQIWIRQYDDGARLVILGD